MNSGPWPITEVLIVSELSKVRLVSLTWSPSIETSIAFTFKRVGRLR